MGMCTVTLFASSPALSPNVQAVVDYYSSPAVHDALIAKGEVHAERFTDPVFIDRFMNAEKNQQDHYINWYGTPCFNQTGLGFGPALQKGDLACIGVAAAGVGLEWLLYQRIQQFFLQAYASQLDSADDWDEKFLACKQKQHWAQLVSLAAMATLLGLAFSHTTKNFYFDTWLKNEHEKPGMVHKCAGPLRQYMLQAINPQTWFDVSNEWLDYFGCVPDWSKTSTAVFTKAFLCNLCCIIWYEYMIIAPQWQVYCKRLQMNPAIIKQHFTTAEQQHAFIAQALVVPSLSWLQTKCYVTIFLNTCFSGILTLIAAGKAYQKLQPMLQEPSCLEAL